MQASTPVHSNTASNPPKSGPLPAVCIADAAVSRAIVNFSSMVDPRFIGTTKCLSAKSCAVANSTRLASISQMTMLDDAPVTLNIAAVRRPTAPAPITRAVEPGASAARRTPWMATLRGSMSAPSSVGTFEGNLNKYPVSNCLACNYFLLSLGSSVEYYPTGRRSRQIRSAVKKSLTDGTISMAH